MVKLDPTGATCCSPPSRAAPGQAGGLPARPSPWTAGNVYFTGNTQAPLFPTTAGCFPSALKGNKDAFVVKLNPTATARLYSTFLGAGGGGATSFGYGIAVDAAGNAYVAGTTSATKFPTTPGHLVLRIKGARTMSSSRK